MYQISYICSPYYRWFVDMGYPELDIVEYRNGEWDIIQYFTAPVIPCMTRWQTVLGPMRNIEIGRGFCEKYVKQLDMSRRVFWAREEAKTKEVEDEHKAGEKHAKEMVDRAHDSFMRNPAMLDRIAKNGVIEMDLGRLARHVPRSEYHKSPYKGVRDGICDSSKPANEVVHEKIPALVREGS